MKKKVATVPTAAGTSRKSNIISLRSLNLKAGPLPKTNRITVIKRRNKNIILSSRPKAASI
jgi:hypothetical protein